jgi:hypothetical protein
MRREGGASLLRRPPRRERRAPCLLNQVSLGSAEFVPRIGERILLEYGPSRETVKPHYCRVKDVMYRLQERPDIQVAIFIEEEDDPELWPGE